jgi:hypothetical protein
MPGGYGIGIGDGVDYTGRKTSMLTFLLCIGSFCAGRRWTVPTGQQDGCSRWRAFQQAGGATQCVPLSTPPLARTERPRAVGRVLSGMLGVSAVAIEGSGNAWKPTAALRVVQENGQNGERRRRRRQGTFGSGVNAFRKCRSLSMSDSSTSTAGGERECEWPAWRSALPLYPDTPASVTREDKAMVLDIAGILGGSGELHPVRSDHME